MENYRMGGDTNRNLDVTNLQRTLARKPHLLVVDTSDPMRPRPADGNEYAKIAAVNRALESFKTDVQTSYRLEMAVDVSVMTFGGDVTIRNEFVRVTDWEPPTLSVGGEPAPMCEAIIEGAHHLWDYVCRLKDEFIPLRKPHVWLLTDGKPTDVADYWEDAKTVIEEGAQTDNLSFDAVGIGPNPDMETLEDLISTVPEESKAQTFEFEPGVFKEFIRDDHSIS